MAIVRTARVASCFLALLFACGTHDGPLPAPPGGGGHVDEELPTPTLVCPAHVIDSYSEMAPLDVVKA